MADEDDNKGEHGTPPQDVPPPHVEPPHDNHPTHDPRVDTLTTKVDELTTMVQDLLNKGEQDSTPVHRPWTHAGGKR